MPCVVKATAADWATVILGSDLNQLRRGYTMQMGLGDRILDVGSDIAPYFPGVVLGIVARERSYAPGALIIVIC